MRFTSDPAQANVIKSRPEMKTAAVSFGAGVTTQELNDALEPSSLFAMGAANGIYPLQTVIYLTNNLQVK